ncbi:hypothetical protein JXB11_02430 [Candidatus Woesearchaeota archaeon]|nr:hypothetical protein [Candidatus Woesearchaeota archaeon]
MCMKWMDNKVKKMDGKDLALTKITVFAFALMLANLWYPIASLDWYWYAIIFVLAGIRPTAKIFK